MKERIKEIRKELKLSQQKFAIALGVSISNIESYEMGRRNPSDAFIQLVCTKYGVNESWLRTGEGEMFHPKDKEQEIAAICAEIIKNGSDDFRFAITKILYEMTEEQKALAVEMLKKLIATMPQEKNPSE